MINFRRRFFFALCSTVLVFAASAQQRKALTNKDIADMAKQGLAEDVIVKVIQASDVDFDTSSAGTAQLQSAGVTPHVIDAMIKAQAGHGAAAISDIAGASTAPATATGSLASAASAVVPTADATGGRFLLKEGVEVPLKFASDLSSKTASDGDRVELLLDGDLKVGDIVVARSGAHAVAVVSNAKKAGMMGKPGELNIQLEHLTVGDNRVRVRGTKGREGDSKTGTAVALTVLFGPIGLIKHGKNVEVKAGTPLTAYVDQDISLPPAN